MSEIEILEELEANLILRTQDLWAETEEIELAEKALIEVRDRLHTLIDREGGYLLSCESRVTIDGKAGINNGHGWIEPDIANPRGTAPIDKAIQLKEEVEW